MKKIVFLSVVCSFLLAGQTYELNIANMGCGGCAKKIKKIANTVSSVENMTYDTKSKDVNITIGDKDDIQKVISTLKNSKYKVKLKTKK